MDPWSRTEEGATAAAVETGPGADPAAEAGPGAGAGPGPGAEASGPPRPLVTELRLSAFKSHRGATYPLGPLTLLAGPSGSGKSSALQAYGLLVRLGAGEPLDGALAAVPGGAAACVPERAAPDAQGRRGFRIGCTVDGPAGPTRLDIAVQTEPELRIAGERLTGGGRTLFTTALTDPGRRTVQAAWLTAGAAPVTRAPLPDDRLGTALLPLRVAGTTAGQRLVLAAAEQTLIALRSSFVCDPRPEAVRAVARAAGPGPGAGASSGAGVADAAEGARLRPDCGNLAAVLERTGRECATRHAALVDAVRAGCPGPVRELRAEPGARRLDWLGDGELRYLALALVLLTGPGVLAVDPVAEVLPARQVLTVVVDGLDRCLDRRQSAELFALAVRMAARGHVRLLGTVTDASAAARLPEVGVLHLGA
ncbi:ATP-binding protein [Streptomyces sp. NPDC000151]|uniref:AAA family ATPase n=1 Tax=Streptomyces sp. NPDC000151 TaxID=3154244 RepID=UPI003323FE74